MVVDPKKIAQRFLMAKHSFAHGYMTIQEVIEAQVGGEKCWCWKHQGRCPLPASQNFILVGGFPCAPFHSNAWGGTEWEGEHY